MEESDIELPHSKSNLAEKIKKELVETNYYNDVKYNIDGKSKWKIIADVTEALANVLIAVSTVLAFAAGVFDYTLLSFLAGCAGTLAFSLLRFSSYSMMESKERTYQVNLLLKNLRIDPIADITIDSAGNELISTKKSYEV